MIYHSYADSFILGALQEEFKSTLRDLLNVMQRELFDNNTVIEMRGYSLNEKVRIYINEVQNYLEEIGHKIYSSINESEGDRLIGRPEFEFQADAFVELAWTAWKKVLKKLNAPINFDRISISPLTEFQIRFYIISLYYGFQAHNKYSGKTVYFLDS